MIICGSNKYIIFRSPLMVLLSPTSMPAMNLLAITEVVFTLDAHQKKSTMLFWLLAMVMKVDKTTGWSRTLGEPIGARTV